MNMNQIYFTYNLHFLTLEEIYNAAIEKITNAGCTSFAEYASNNYKSEVR